LAVVAEELAALRVEPTSRRPASRLRVALARKVQELSTVRREIATLRRENAALKSQLASGYAPEPPMGSGLLKAVDLELPAGPDAPRRARSEIRRAIEGGLPEHDSATAILLTSELVANAVVHSQQSDDATIGLRIIRSQNRLRVEVTDSGSGFDPAARLRAEPRSGGLGLLLVGRLSDRWGATRRMSNQRRRFCVWYELTKTPG
jgi:anti-sigma regulatory factor (Ser/Thr protein kinase)